MQNRSAVYHPFLKQMKREYSLKSDLKLKELKIEHEFKDSTDELLGYLVLQVAHSSGNSPSKTLHVAVVQTAFKTTLIQPSYGSLSYLEKRGSWKILAGSWNLGNVFDKSWSLVSAWFVFTFFESRNFLSKSLRVEFLTRISVSRRVSDFTIRHPFLRVWMGLTDNWQIVPKIYVTTDICLGFYWQMAKDLYFLQHPFMRLFNSIFPLFS